MTADYYDILEFLLDLKPFLGTIRMSTQWNLRYFKFSSLSFTVTETENGSLKFLSTGPLSFF